MSESSDEAELLFREHGAKLWRSLLAFSGDPEVANNAMAEAFAQLLHRAEAVRSQKRWVWTVAFRIARGEMRERSRLADHVAADPSHEMPEPARDLIRALRMLSPNQRACAVLHFYADRPTREVAAILGMSPATVRVHLSQARRRLRALLEETDG